MLQAKGPSLPQINMEAHKRPYIEDRIVILLRAPLHFYVNLEECKVPDGHVRHQPRQEELSLLKKDSKPQHPPDRPYSWTMTLPQPQSLQKKENQHEGS